VHDIFFVHREGRAAWVFQIPSIPAGRSAGFILEDHALGASPPGSAADSPIGALRQALVDPVLSAPPDPNVWPGGECIMGRDPAIPFERAEGHRLYAAEVDLILGVWAERFFERPGTSIIYREDTAQLDEVMPLSIYTDMFHHVVLRRAGLALWQDVALP